MNVGYYYNAVTESIQDLATVNEVTNAHLETVLHRLHRALVHLGQAMVDDGNQSDAAISGLQRTVEFLERSIYSLAVLGQQLNSRMLTRRIRRTMSFAVVPTVDYDGIRARTEWLRLELAQFLFHPTRIQNWIAQGNELESYMM